MSLLQFLRDIPNFQEYSRKSKIILFGHYLRQHEGLVEFSVKDIQNICRGVLKPPSQLPQQLELLSKGRKAPLMKGSKTGYYSLTISSLKEVEDYLSVRNQAFEPYDNFLAQAIPYLKKFIAKVSEDTKRKFMAEAVSCLGVDARRAAIIMTWAGTIGHLYDYILTHKLDDFNNALHNRRDKYSRLTIACKDDFSDIRESVFIEICRAAKIISNDVQKILGEKLGIRNTCAHPSGVEVHPTKVVNFVEDLMDNVIVKFKI